MTPDRTERSSVPDAEGGGAAFDAAREYRYRLWRTWDAEKPAVAFVMLNPSTADEDADDPTIRRCVGYASEWGYGTLEVVNLFGLRATDPSALRDHRDPVGDANDEYLRRVCDAAAFVVAAWGGNGYIRDRGRQVARFLDAQLHALDTTRDGHPVHPLYQPADAVPEPWDERSLETGKTRG